VKKPAYLGRYQGEEEEVESDLTPECALCGEAHVGLENEAVMILRGQWWNNEEIDTPMFLLHPRTKLRVLQLPGGQLALVSDQMGKPTEHAHHVCFEHLQSDFLEEVVWEHSEPPPAALRILNTPLKRSRFNELLAEIVSDASDIEDALEILRSYLEDL
jgi:hypothetical protein